jgi:hypothetical protein
MMTKKRTRFVSDEAYFVKGKAATSDEDASDWNLFCRKLFLHGDLGINQQTRYKKGDTVDAPDWSQEGDGDAPDWS